MLFMVVLGSCKVKMSLLSNEASVIDINQKGNYVVLFWPCVTIPYKLQPCFSLSEHPIQLLNNPQIGDKYILKKIQ